MKSDMATMKEDIAEIRRLLGNCATKDDLKAFATKDDLLAFKKELKDDIAGVWREVLLTGRRLERLEERVS